MAKKKKKESKTLKALLVLLLVVAAVGIGVTLGSNAFKMNQDKNNPTVAADVDENANQNRIDNASQNGAEDQNSVKDQEATQPEQQPEDQGTEEPEEQQEDQAEQQPEDSNEDDNAELPQGSDTGDLDTSEVDVNGLSNISHSWSWKRNKEHKRPEAYNKFDIKPYDAYYVMNTDEKVVYLTMDEGYENGYTSMILDTLKANDVQAAFFVTKPYVEKNLELTKRMKEEGHIVGNHTVNHKKMPTQTDEEINYEIEETERYFEEMTGYKMDKFFRPPTGEYSERTLYLTQQLGYKTMFWSLAYADWYREKEKQPGKEYALNHVLENAHPGMMPLLHAVSSSNAEALDDIIKQLKEQGYRFGSLYEIE